MAENEAETKLGLKRTSSSQSETNQSSNSKLAKNENSNPVAILEHFRPENLRQNFPEVAGKEISEIEDNLIQLQLDPAKKTKPDDDENTTLQWIIGRSMLADFLIKSITVSRQHATICYKISAKEWRLVNHKSVNGTYINDKKLGPGESQIVKTNDVISLANNSKTSPYVWKFVLKPKPAENPSEKNVSNVSNWPNEEPVSKRVRFSDVQNEAKTEKSDNLDKDEKNNEKQEDKEKDKEMPPTPSSKKVLDKLRDKFNEELSCSLCYEVFISPQSLPCGHVFCKFCLNRWKQNCRSSFVCPNCRQKVGREKICPNFCLENLISSWTSELGAEMLEQRSNSMKEREKQEKELEKEQKRKEEERKSKVNRRGRRRNQNQNIRVFFEGQSRDQQEESRAPTEVESSGNVETSVSDVTDDSGTSRNSPITISSESEDEFENYYEDFHGGLIEPLEDHFDENEDSEDWVDGLAGSFYGGYGRCFRCNARGHWAPGCPN